MLRRGHLLLLLDRYFRTYAGLDDGFSRWRYDEVDELVWELSRATQVLTLQSSPGVELENGMRWQDFWPARPGGMLPVHHVDLLVSWYSSRSTCTCVSIEVAVRVEARVGFFLVTWSTSRCSLGPSRWIYPDILRLGHLWTDIPGLAQVTNKMFLVMCSGFAAGDGGHPSKREEEEVLNCTVPPSQLSAA